MDGNILLGHLIIGTFKKRAPGRCEGEWRNDGKNIRNRFYEADTQPIRTEKVEDEFFSDLGQFKYGLQTTELFTKGNSDILDWGAPIVANCRL